MAEHTKKEIKKFYKSFDDYTAALVEHGFICGDEYALQMVKEGVYDVRDC